VKHGHEVASRVTRYEVAYVKTLRESLAITQAQLAQALGTSVDTIKSWERAWSPKCQPLFRITPSFTTNWPRIKITSKPNHLKGAFLRSLCFC